MIKYAAVIGNSLPQVVEKINALAEEGWTLVGTIQGVNGYEYFATMQLEAKICSTSCGPR